MRAGREGAFRISGWRTGALPGTVESLWWLPSPTDAMCRRLADFWRRSEWGAPAGKVDREVRAFRVGRPRDRVVYGGMVVHLHPGLALPEEDQGP